MHSKPSRLGMLKLDLGGRPQDVLAKVQIPRPQLISLLTFI